MKIKIMEKMLITLFIGICMAVASYAEDIEPEEYEVYTAVFASGKLDGMPFGYVVLEQKTLKKRYAKTTGKI